MKITKLGHCCMVIKEGDLTVLTDPGVWTTAQNGVKGIDVLLITHEHADHLHTGSVKKIIVNNPQVKIFTVKSVGKLLEVEGLEYQVLGHEDSVEEKGVRIEAFGEKHADIYPGVPVVENTGYLIAEKFWYPGDAFYNLQKSVEILALPVAGPWIKISEAIDYAMIIKPKICFPVHDGMLKYPGGSHIHPKNFLSKEGIEFSVLEEGRSYSL